MKKFKDLINEVSLQWFLPMVKEKFNEFAKSPQLEMLNNQMMQISKTEYNQELNKTFDQIKSLDSYADIIGFIRMNKIDLTDSLDATKLQESIMQGGLKSLPNLLVKIQLGYISEISGHFFNEVRMWQDKLGRETDLEEIKLEDLKYLVRLSLKKVVDEIKAIYINESDVLNEINEELTELESSHATLSQRRNDYTIIKIYFNKLRQQMFDSLSSTMMESNEKMPEHLTKSASELEKVSSLVTEIEFILDFYTQIERQLKEKTV